MILLRCYARVTDWIYEMFNHASVADYRFLPIYTYGFWVAMGFFAAATLATIEMRRREKLGLLKGQETEVTYGDAPNTMEIALYFLLGFVAFFKLVGILAYQPQLSNYSLAMKDYLFSLTYGSWIGGILGGGALAAYYYYGKKRAQLPTAQKKAAMIFPSDNMGDLVVIAAVFGVLGSVLFNFLESPEPVSEQLARLKQSPLEFFTSGLSVYGGLICAGIGFAVYAKIKKFNLAHFFDSVAAPFILANGIGRLGCHNAGDGDWGLVNIAPKPGWLPELFWQNYYQHNIIDAGVPIPGCVEEHCRQLAQPVYPTPIYEFMMCAVIFLVLWSLRKKLTYMPGMVFTVFMIFIGIQRYSIEQLRDLSERHLYNIAGMQFKQSELISIALFIIGVASTTYLYRYYQKRSKPA